MTVVLQDFSLNNIINTTGSGRGFATVLRTSKTIICSYGTWKTYCIRMSNQSLRAPIEIRDPGIATTPPHQPPLPSFLPSLRATMAAPKLSSGTLGLRFMQNAALRKVAQTDKAAVPVKDPEEVDGEWEIPKARMQEGWGSTSASGGGQSGSVSYEASYIPFLFGADDEDGEERVVKRRRTFKKGREVRVDEPVAIPMPIPQADMLPDAEASKGRTKTKSSSSSSKIRSISSQGGTGTGKAKKSTSTSAREAVFKASVDAAPQLPVPTPAPTPTPTTFLRPAGVDAPPQATGRGEPDPDAPVKEKKNKKARKRAREEDADADADVDAAVSAGEPADVVEDDKPKKPKKKKLKKGKKAETEGGA
ncbi:hypothetical protein MKEN_01165100 [Mycena kentingensis (nom. inval.)]|nr:hypothetical protein MKEN_01165100 [Mycena kentingensis (nom. inval.)]